MRQHSVSRPRSSNRTADLPHPAFRLASSHGTRRGAKMNAAEPKHAKLTEHRFTTEAAGTARGHLMTPTQEGPHAIVHVVVHRPVGHQARPITKVRAPAAQQTVQPIAHERPWRLIARDEDLTNLALEPL